MPDPELLIDGPPDAAATIALAHGANAPMDSPFMAFFAAGFAEAGLRVVRFEFPYMAERRRTGTRRPPDRINVLLETWRSVIDRLGPEGLVIGGKSLGGRVASMLADTMEVRGLVCLGYPFQPPGKAQPPRIAHLAQLRTPTLILQGTRDPFGGLQKVADYPLSPAIALHWLEDGDHGFAPRLSSGRSERQNWAEALNAALAFLAARASIGRFAATG